MYEGRGGGVCEWCMRGGVEGCMRGGRGGVCEW